MPHMVQSVLYMKGDKLINSSKFVCLFLFLFFPSNKETKHVDTLQHCTQLSSLKYRGRQSEGVNVTPTNYG